MSINDMPKEEFEKYYNDLWNLVEPLREYYDIDKVKTYAVYVWNKADRIEDQENVFDIHSREIIMWNEEHEIIEEAIPIIEEIQDKLKEFDKYLER